MTVTTPNPSYPEIDRGIRELSGKVNIGDIVGHESETLTYELIDIVNDMGYCVLPNNTMKVWPVTELFDVNKLKRRAVELRLLSTGEN